MNVFAGLTLVCKINITVPDMLGSVWEFLRMTIVKTIIQKK